VRYAKTIHSCGDDLIQLINDILDLSKIESGYISADFIQCAVQRESLRLWETDPSNTYLKVRASNLRSRKTRHLPEIIETDVQRLNQIIKNLLSNAFKFTEKGEVKLRIYESTKNWRTGSASLDKARKVVAFEITDTGIGIMKEKQNIIFEAFQQAEGSTSRKYGGTGLGPFHQSRPGGPVGWYYRAGKRNRKRKRVYAIYLPLDYNPKLMKKEKPTSLVISEYELGAKTMRRSLSQTVPTIKIPDRDPGRCERDHQQCR